MFPVIVGLGTLLVSTIAATLGGVFVGGAVAATARPNETTAVEVKDGGNVNMADPGSTGADPLGNIMSMLPTLLMVGLMAKFM